VADFIGESNFLQGKVKSINGRHALVTIPAWKQDLQATLVGDVIAGDEVQLSVRPEKIHIADLPPAGGNCTEGTVVNTTYIGSDTHVYLDIGGQQVKVWEQNRMSSLDPQLFYRKGQKLWAAFPPDNVLVLPKE
jgi:ABC-type Fe3+/spermidine/putrescine transport system ATPase subunit